MHYDRKLVSEIVLNYIRDGLSVKDATALAGVSKKQFYQWATEDKALKAEIAKARIECKVVHVRNIRNHAQEDWKASAWMLERMFPKEFAKRTVIELPKQKETDDAILVRVPTVEEAKQIAIERAKAKAVAEEAGESQGGE